MRDEVKDETWDGLGSYPTEIGSDGVARPAVIKLVGVDDDTANAEHMRKVQERYAELQNKESGQAITRKAQEIDAKAPKESRGRLLETAAKGTSWSKRIAWLRREADLTVRASEGISACRSGCSSCCHMAVAVTEQEARVIAKETGMTLLEPPPEDSYELDLTDEAAIEKMIARGGYIEQEQGDRWKGVRCPFLDNGPEMRCSIYAKSRPLACRNLINLDKDDLLCRLVEGGKIGVPYLGRVESQLAAMFALGPKVKFADLRDWFGTSQRQR